MLTIWAYGRAIVYLKRISICLERIARAQENASVAITPPRPTKFAEVFSPTVEERNRLYDEEYDGR